MMSLIIISWGCKTLHCCTNVLFARVVTHRKDLYVATWISILTATGGGCALLTLLMQAAAQLGLHSFMSPGFALLQLQSDVSTVARGRGTDARERERTVPALLWNLMKIIKCEFIYAADIIRSCKPWYKIFYNFLLLLMLEWYFVISQWHIKTIPNSILSFQHNIRKVVKVFVSLVCGLVKWYSYRLFF